jgi:thiol-disulfide isomerase/thioredoxin
MHTNLAALLLAAALPALALAGGERARPEAKSPAPPTHPWSIGAPMPTFAGQNLADAKRGSVALSSLKGQPVLVNLWASWCGPCVTELPGLGRLDGQFAPRGLKIVGVSIDDHFSEAEMVTGDLDLKYLMLFDSAQASMDAWRAETIPASFLYDRAGRLVWRHSGLIRFDDPAFLAAIEVALKKP